MMSQPGGRSVGPVGQNAEHFRVQTLLAHLWNRIFERASGQLVAEAERAILAANHSDAQATLDTRLLEAAGSFQQPAFRSAGDNTHQLRDFARAG